MRHWPPKPGIVGSSPIWGDQQQSGAAEACWAHNPEVDGPKPSSASWVLRKQMFTGGHWYFPQSASFSMQGDPWWKKQKKILKFSASISHNHSRVSASVQSALMTLPMRTSMIIACAVRCKQRCFRARSVTVPVRCVAHVSGIVSVQTGFELVTFWPPGPLLCASRAVIMILTLLFFCWNSWQRTNWLLEAPVA